MKIILRALSRASFCLLVLLCGTLGLAAQCPPAGTVFSSQRQIDEMASRYSDCTVLNGNLVLQEVVPGSINNLNGFNKLEEVEGDVVVRRLRDLESLAGLDQLTRIGGELNIQGNPRLSSFNGLGQLSYVGSQVIIANNVGLTALTGTERLLTVNGSLYLRKNPRLASINGLSGLKNVVGDLVISGNPALLSLNGLQNLSSLGTSVPRAQLQITDNPSLGDLSGLAALDFSALTYLEITNCPSLSGEGRSTATGALCNYLNNAGRARIYGNGAGFDSVEVLRAGCGR